MAEPHIHKKRIARLIRFFQGNAVRITVGNKVFSTDKDEPNAMGLKDFYYQAMGIKTDDELKRYTRNSKLSKTGYAYLVNIRIKSPIIDAINKYPKNPTNKTVADFIDQTQRSIAERLIRYLKFIDIPDVDYLRKYGSKKIEGFSWLTADYKKTHNLLYDEIALSLIFLFIHKTLMCRNNNFRHFTDFLDNNPYRKENDEHSAEQVIPDLSYGDLRLQCEKLHYRVHKFRGIGSGIDDIKYVERLITKNYPSKLIIKDDHELSELAISKEPHEYVKLYFSQISSYLIKNEAPPFSRNFIQKIFEYAFLIELELYITEMTLRKAIRRELINSEYDIFFSKDATGVLSEKEGNKSFKEAFEVLMEYDVPLDPDLIFNSNSLFILNNPAGLSKDNVLKPLGLNELKSTFLEKYTDELLRKLLEGYKISAENMP